MQTHRAHADLATQGTRSARRDEPGCDHGANREGCHHQDCERSSGKETRTPEKCPAQAVRHGWPRFFVRLNTAARVPEALVVQGGPFASPELLERRLGFVVYVIKVIRTIVRC